MKPITEILDFHDVEYVDGRPLHKLLPQYTTQEPGKQPFSSSQQHEPQISPGRLYFLRCRILRNLIHISNLYSIMSKSV